MDCMRRPGLGQHRVPRYGRHVAWKLCKLWQWGKDKEGTGTRLLYGTLCETKMTISPQTLGSSMRQRAYPLAVSRAMPMVLLPVRGTGNPDGRMGPSTETIASPWGVNKYAYRIRFPKLGN